MYRISHSVGKQGVNQSKDVKIVQALLNRQIVPPARLLKVDGLAGSKTITAICAFQFRLGAAENFGLVRPASLTFGALCSLPHSVPVTKRCLKVFAGFSQIFGNTATALSSDIQNRMKVLWTIEDRKSSKPKSLPMQHRPPSPPNAIVWGAKVTPEFKRRVIEICEELGFNPDYLMACMAFESRETFTSNILNQAGSGAIGLIQFMPATAEWLNTTTDELAHMSPIEQLEYVRKYFLTYKGKVKTSEDIYMAILWPKAIGKDPDTAIFKAGTKFYAQNSGFDKNPYDGEITPRECAAAVSLAYKKGLTKGYFG
jgi:hypothetical protein